MPPIPVRLPDKSALEEIPFAPGGNLPSIPEEPAHTSPAAVLEAVGRPTHVIAYDGCDAADPGKLYDPADPAATDLTAMDRTIGFWIEATLPVDLPSEGTLTASTSIRLCPGWNLIGFLAAQARPVRNALASIEGKYVRVFGYDAFAAEDPWDGFGVSFPDWGNDLKVLDARREMVTNRLGLARVFVSDERGNVLGEANELGEVMTRIYDAKDRLLTETDPLGSSRPTPMTVTDPLGNDRATKVTKRIIDA